MYAVVFIVHAGKSNLMDAISFVLGERTAQLRVRNLKVRRVPRQGSVCTYTCTW